MRRITKQEAMYLVKHGVIYGDGGLKITTGHHKSWYMTESKKNESLLNKYHREVIAK